MLEMNDMELVREYAQRNSEPAFAELVQRHINFVYSVAMRYVGNAEDAQDIAQAVFIILAKKSADLRDSTVVTGWLYETTRFTAIDFLRSKTRRETREHKDYMESTLNDSETVSVWQQLAPMLEEVMTRLSEKERTVLALHFFENKNGAEMAAALGIEESAARKRLTRAVERLRKLFGRRGIAISSGVLIATLTANSVQAAPPALANSISAVAVTKGAAAGSSTLSLVKGALKAMAWTKVKTAIVVGVAFFAVGTTATVVAIKEFDAQKTESYFKRLDFDYLQTARPMMLLRPSKYPNQGSHWIGQNVYGSCKLLERGAPFTRVLSAAYGFGPEEMVVLTNLPSGQFDLLATIPVNSQSSLRQEINKRFGVTGQAETRNQDVLVLKNIDVNAPGLKISAEDGSKPRTLRRPGYIKFIGYKVSDACGVDLVHELGLLSGLPVVDETGLTNAYDIELSWDANLQEDAQKEAIQSAMKEQLGLVLVPDHRGVKMLVVK